MSIADTAAAGADGAAGADAAGVVAQPLRALGRERLIDRAATAIKDYILANRLNGGDRLPSESELARALGVSRNVIRQAVSTLETLGVVRVAHGRGMYVADVAGTSVFQQLASWLNASDLQDDDFLEVRGIFERGVFALVMQRATDEDFDRLEALAADLNAAETEDEAARRHDVFHQALLAAAGNPFLETVGAILYRFFWSVGYSSPHVQLVPRSYQKATHGDLVRRLRQRQFADIPALVALHLGRRVERKGAR